MLAANLSLMFTGVRQKPMLTLPAFSPWMRLGALRATSPSCRNS
jgi:hypothetical protein